MIRLICADVDGTLIGASGVPHPDVWEAAARARAAGIRVALASGRPAFGHTLGYARQLDPTGWHIFQNGASVLHPEDGRSRSSRFPADAERYLVRRSRETGRIIELYSDTAYVVEDTRDIVRVHAGVLGVPFAPGNLEHPPRPVVRAQWMLDPADGPAVLAEDVPGVEYSPSTSPMMPDTLFVSVMPSGVSKATGVATVAAAYGVAMDEVMFVGDGWNDATAMRAVGWPVAMGNAEPEVHALARHTVGHVDDVGVVEAFEWAMAHGR